MQNLNFEKYLTAKTGNPTEAGWGEPCQQTTHTVQRRPWSGVPLPSQSRQLTSINNPLLLECTLLVFLLKCWGVVILNHQPIFITVFSCLFPLQ